jgi:hypothetical protein
MRLHKEHRSYHAWSHLALTACLASAMLGYAGRRRPGRSTTAPLGEENDRGTSGAGGTATVTNQVSGLPARTNEGKIKLAMFLPQPRLPGHTAVAHRR